MVSVAVEQHEEALRRLRPRPRRRRRPGTRRRRRCAATQSSCSSSRSSKRNSSRSSSRPQPRVRSRSSLPQVPVHEGDGHGALADGRGHPLHRVRPDVAGDEDAGEAGLQEARVAVGRPARPAAGRRLSSAGPVGTKPCSSADHGAVEPVGARGAADEDEQVARRAGSPARRCCASWRVTRLQVPVALRAGDRACRSAPRCSAIPAICSIEVGDIEASSECPRTSRCTERRTGRQKTAACPAELAPPTT